MKTTVFEPSESLEGRLSRGIFMDGNGSKKLEDIESQFRKTSRDLRRTVILETVKVILLAATLALLIWQHLNDNWIEKRFKHLGHKISSAEEFVDILNRE